MVISFYQKFFFSKFIFIQKFKKSNRIFFKFSKPFGCLHLSWTEIFSLQLTFVTLMGHWYESLLYGLHTQRSNTAEVWASAAHFSLSLQYFWSEYYYCCNKYVWDWRNIIIDIGVIIFGKKFKWLQNELITIINAIFMLVISNIKHFNRNIYCNELTKDHSNILYSNAL